MFVTSETDITGQIPVEEMFILARGDAVVHTIVVQTTVPANSELVVGVTVSVVTVVITALAIISVVICIACVCYKKQVRKMEIELREVQMVLPNPSYGQATQPNPSYGQITQPNYNPSYGQINPATQPNPSYGQTNPATQPNDGIVGTDDGQYETVKDVVV